jgi:hypothetical protein
MYSRQLYALKCRTSIKWWVWMKLVGVKPMQFYIQAFRCSASVKRKVNKFHFLTTRSSAPKAWEVFWNSILPLVTEVATDWKFGNLEEKSLSYQDEVSCTWIPLQDLTYVSYEIVTWKFQIQFSPGTRFCFIKRYIYPSTHFLTLLIVVLIGCGADSQMTLGLYLPQKILYWEGYIIWSESPLL